MNVAANNNRSVSCGHWELQTTPQPQALLSADTALQVLQQTCSSRQVLPQNTAIAGLPRVRGQWRGRTCPAPRVFSSASEADVFLVRRCGPRTAGCTVSLCARKLSYGPLYDLMSPAVVTLLPAVWSAEAVRLFVHILQEELKLDVEALRSNLVSMASLPAYQGQ